MSSAGQKKGSIDEPDGAGKAIVASKIEYDKTAKREISLNEANSMQRNKQCASRTRRVKDDVQNTSDMSGGETMTSSPLDLVEMMVIDEDVRNEDDGEFEAEDTTKRDGDFKIDDNDFDGTTDERMGNDEEDMWEDFDSDLEAMLEEDLPQEYKKKAQGKKRKTEELDSANERQNDGGDSGAKEQSASDACVIRTKKVLKRKGKKNLEGLPKDWIEVPHVTGMPLYLHRPSRTCTWAMPYNLGPASVRRHRPPVSSIPCLHYKRAKGEVKVDSSKTDSQPSGTQENHQPSSSKTTPPQSLSKDLSASTCPNGASLISLANGTMNGNESTVSPVSEVKENNPQASSTNPEGVSDSQPSASEPKPEAQQTSTPYDHANKVTLRSEEIVEHEDLSQYFESLFEFQMIEIKKFKSWKLRRQALKEEKLRKAGASIDRPQFPLVPTFECLATNKEGEDRIKEVVLDMKEKSPVSVLLEYTQRVMKAKPIYNITETNNVNSPYEAVIQIEGCKYGRGAALSKRIAKMQAAVEKSNSIWMTYKSDEVPVLLGKDVNGMTATYNLITCQLFLRGM